ncbi:hypothetical protein [Deinococcus knuensis]|uniref:hypothetical protein n=1 Tax=Deinococcus knuensis TaxID=1837380 RepID=UPI00166A8780|nr:hypothetical protein [Deinococcus knuensis]
MNGEVFKRDPVFSLMVRAAALLGAATLPGAAAQALKPDPLGPLEGVRRFMTSFQPAAGEASLLAYARRERLDWPATQNLFTVQVHDAPNHYLEWRGHSALESAGPTFTTVRAATFLRAGQALLVLNREWCAAGQCQVRHVFAWQGAGAWKVVPEASVIPALRDEEFIVGRAPACLRGVTLGVQYLPARLGTTLNVLPLVPDTARRACEAAGVNLGTATRPVTLNWTVSVGKFRR